MLIEHELMYHRPLVQPWDAGVDAQNFGDSETVESNRCNRCLGDQRNAKRSAHYTSDVTG